MKIKSNALPHEQDSPFYEANKKFCQVFERFIASKKGSVKGTYNTVGYIIYGNIPSNYTWDLKYKKAIFTSAGKLLRSSKRENFLILVEWTCQNVSQEKVSYFIRKRKFSDRIKPLYNRLEAYPTYVIKSKGKQSDFFLTILEILTPLFEAEKIYRITLKRNKLTIELRSEAHHFDIFEQLTHLS
ncbi:hypothetical protein [Kordia jejudonensis]|uniref:hypothetical protein n=1 Tax=Kordia jejudonensis TaxID=1348245 RepID=UPI0006292E2B|nr:hypothetical protein [Kordia jejudonensis]